MKTFTNVAAFFRSLIFIAFFFLSNQLHATHIAGADLTYTCLGGLTYQIELTFYRDCAGSAAPNGYGILFKSQSCGYRFTDTIVRIVPTGEEITFPCASATTRCTNVASPNPGLQRYIYRGIVTLPGACTDWIFSWHPCCRNCDITTMTIPPGCGSGSNSAIYVEATLDNLNFPCNSSPVFSNIPISFLCVGQNFVFNHGVIDPDGDSLAYTLINARRDSVDTIPYIAPFTGTNPLTSSPPVSIDPLTGDISMSPTSPEVGVIAVLIEQYRNGVLVGSVLRDMQVYVRNCTNNLPSASGIDSTTVRDTTICANTPFCFDIYSLDIDSGQTVTMSWNSGISNATFNITGSPYPVGTFCWTPNDSDISLNPHTFTVTVLDDACPNNGFQTFSYNIFVPTPYFNTAVSDALCNGDSSGIAVAFPIFGGNYDYVWNPGGVNNDTLSNVSPGTYNVTVTDLDIGCTATRSVTIGQPVTISTLLSQTNVACNGDSSGSASVTPSGGIAPYTFQWSTSVNDTNATVNNLPAGTYFVTTTDSNGCSRLDSVIISDTSQAIVANVANGFNLTCNGDTTGNLIATATGGTGSLNYSWNSNPVQLNDTAFNLAAAVYTVTVTDSLGCTATASNSVTQPTPIVFSDSMSVYAGGDNIRCNGESNGSIYVTVTGSNGGYTYLWNTADTTSFIQNQGAGPYTLTVTDSAGCVSSVNYTLIEPAILNVNANAIAISCAGQNDGALTSTVSGGHANYQFTWQPGNYQSPNVNGIGPGTYTVVVIDTNGCVDSATVQVNPPVPVTSIHSSTNANCGNNDGTAEVHPSGGTPNYTFNWTPQGGTDSVAINLPSGTYYVLITDALGCSTTDTVAVGNTNNLSGSATQVNPVCNGDTTGSAIVTSVGGNGTLTYSWSPNTSNDSTAFNLGVGLYICTITDTGNCMFQVPVNITEPQPVSANLISKTDVYCGGDSSGSAILSPIGGNGGYSFSWSPYGGNAASATGLDSGVYIITITDSLGCSGTASVTINQIQINITTNTQSLQTILCNGDITGSATVTASGGIPQYSYIWSTNPVQNGDTIFGVGSGTYYVTITDSVGCIKSDSVVIGEPNAISISFNAPSYDCSTGLSGALTASVNGGTPNYHYQWNTSVNDTLASVNPTSPGTFNVSVTDDNGCNTSASYTITTNNQLSVNAGVSQIDCNGNANGSIQLTVVSGSGNYTYVWTPSSLGTGSTVSNLSANSYSVTVNDTSTGCSFSSTYSIVDPPTLTGTITSVNEGCGGSPAGSASTSVSGGTGNYHYQWSSGANDTLSSVSNLTANTYTLTVTDDNNCSFSLGFNIIQNPSPIADAGADTLICFQLIDYFGLYADTLFSGSGLWTTNTTGAIIQFANQNNAILYPSIGDNVLYWTVTQDACVDIDTLNITYRGSDCEEEFDMPTGYTPNGDGENDGYYIKGLDMYLTNQFEVFNRWGNKVYEKTNYRNTDWVGQNKNDENLPDGTYFVVFKSGEFSKSTYVDLRR